MTNLNRRDFFRVGLGAGAIIVSSYSVAAQVGNKSEALLSEEGILHEIKKLPLESLTQGESLKPIMHIIHEYWRNFPKSFQIKFSELLVESLIKRGLIKYSKYKIKEVGTMIGFDTGERFFEIIFHNEIKMTTGEKTSSLPVFYNSTADTQLTYDQIVSLENLGFQYHDGEISNGKQQFSVLYAGDGDVPEAIKDAFKLNKSFDILSLQGVKIFKILHKHEEKKIFFSLGFKNSSKFTQIFIPVDNSIST